jgi:hypothetical protein
LAKSFNVELPQAATLDAMLDKILPNIRPHGEDLREEKFYLGKHYLEVRDDESFHDVVLHVFNAEGEYISSTNGKVDCGEWRLLGNKMNFGPSTCEGCLYDLAFLDDEFFILQRHGNTRLFERKYMVLIVEKLAKKMEWNESMEYLFDKYRNSSAFYWLVAMIVFLLIAIMLLLR